MTRVLLALVLVGCSGGGPATETEDTDPGGCEIPCQFSTANSGGLCQANLFCDVNEPAVYCGEEADGTYTCDCGAAAENPPSFSSPDFCDLEAEARVCAAIEQCGNWVME